MMLTSCTSSRNTNSVSLTDKVQESTVGLFLTDRVNCRTFPILGRFEGSILCDALCYNILHSSPLKINTEVWFV